MSVYRTILVPTDFSPTSQAALDHALLLAAEMGATVVIQHVTELPIGLAQDELLHPAGEVGVVRVQEYARAGARRLLGAEADRVSGGPVTLVLRADFGSVVPTILTAARAVAADLIVVGTHGRTGLAHALLGSVAERVVRLAPVPVLTIRHAPRPGEVDDPLTGEEHQLEAEHDG